MSQSQDPSELRKLFALIHAANDITTASESSEDDIAQMLDVKLLSGRVTDTPLEVLDDMGDELKDEFQKLMASLEPKPKDAKAAFDAVRKDPVKMRHSRNIQRGFELLQEVREECGDIDEDMFANVVELVSILARVRVERDVVPLLARGLYSTELRAAIAFWETTKESPDGAHEGVWQEELAKRPGILSHLLGGHIVLMGEQMHVGNVTLDGSGDKIADYLLRHAMTTNITLIEIKHPETDLLGSRYRNTYPLSKDVSGSISQVLHQRNELRQNFHQKNHQSDEKFTVNGARCIVIAGRADKQLAGDPAKAAAFEMQRDAVSSSVRIITFDELYAQFRSFNRL